MDGNLKATKLKKKIVNSNGFLWGSTGNENSTELHRTASFLGGQQLPIWSIHPLHFMESDGSLACSQQPATRWTLSTSPSISFITSHLLLRNFCHHLRVFVHFRSMWKTSTSHHYRPPQFQRPRSVWRSPFHRVIKRSLYTWLLQYKSSGAQRLSFEPLCWLRKCVFLPINHQ